jgi:hypothetical protein
LGEAKNTLNKVFTNVQVKSPKQWEEIRNGMMTRADKVWEAIQSSMVFGKYQDKDGTKFTELLVEGELTADDMVKATGAGKPVPKEESKLLVALATVALTIVVQLKLVLLKMSGARSWAALKAENAARGAQVLLTKIKVANLKELLSKNGEEAVVQAYKVEVGDKIHFLGPFLRIMPKEINEIIDGIDEFEKRRGGISVFERADQLTYTNGVLNDADKLKSDGLDALIIGVLHTFSKAVVKAKVHAVEADATNQWLAARVAALEVELEAARQQAQRTADNRVQQRTADNRVQQRPQQGHRQQGQPAVPGADAQGGLYCHKCNQPGHIKASCVQYTCGGCGKAGPGHTWPNCPNPRPGLVFRAL